MQRIHWLFAVTLVLFMLVTLAPAAAQETKSGEEVQPAAETESAPEEESAADTAAATEFQTTVRFSPLNAVSLDGSAGEIDIKSVEFEVAGAKGSGIKGAFSSGDADMSAIVTTRLGCATKSATKWKIDMMVEFLDADGNVIDRAMSSAILKNNEKTFDFKHTTLRWAVDHIDTVRVTVKAKE